MEVCKDRDTVASRILKVFRHQEEHHNLLRRLTEKEIESEGKLRLVCLFYVSVDGNFVQWKPIREKWMILATD